MLMRTQVEGGIPPLNLPITVEDVVTLVCPRPEAENVGLVEAFEVKVKVALCVPPLAGVNVTVTTCVPPGESVNEVGLATYELLLLVRFVTVTGRLPEFVTFRV
jgi:hypothetical protein